MALTGQSRTILGPLLTTFTPSPSCSTPVAQCEVPGCDLAWQAQSCVATGIQDNSDCWPPRSGSVTLSTHNPSLYGWGFYSPGISCPAGYKSACTATGGGSWDWPVQFSIYVGETAVGCCPSGYTCNNSYFQTCISTLTGDSTFVVADCTSGTTVDVETYQLPLTGAVLTTDSEDNTYTTTIPLSSYYIYAPMIQINWQSKDLATSTTIPVSTAPIAPTTPTSPTSSTSTTPVTSPSPPSSSSLSTGARAGIGVGVAIVALAAIAAFLFFFFRYRRRAKHNYAPPPGGASPVDADDKKGPGLGPAGEFVGGRGGLHEMGTSGNVPELPGERVNNVYELQGRVAELHG